MGKNLKSKTDEPEKVSAKKSFSAHFKLFNEFWILFYLGRIELLWETELVEASLKRTKFWDQICFAVNGNDFLGKLHDVEFAIDASAFSRYHLIHRDKQALIG